ncbi:unnamed protein product, partial [marine sediment metagenome]
TRAELVTALDFADESELNQLFNENAETVCRELGAKLGIAAADVEATYNLHNWDRTAATLRNVYRFASLARQVGMGPDELYALLVELGLEPGNISSYVRFCALAAAPGHLFELLQETELSFINVNSYARVAWLRRIDRLAASLGVSIEELSQLDLWEHDVAAEDVDEILLPILRSQYETSQLEKELEKPNQRIWEQTRNALRAYALAKSGSAGIPTVKALSDELLIDLETSPRLTTTEAQQAVESVQAFVLRVRTGQEDVPG